MGDSKRRRALAEQQPPALLPDAFPEARRQHAAAAVRQLVTSITDVHGADCPWYALVGAGLLGTLGLRARPAAGSAVWRVGPGDSDSVAHAPEIVSEGFLPSPEPQAGGGLPRGALFHAWVEIDSGYGRTDVVDFTTWQLPRKAAELDALAGGRTDVRWAPPYLWVRRDSCVSPRAAVQAADAGVFSYVSKPDVERAVFTAPMLEEVPRLVSAARMIFNAIEAGNEITVAGVSHEEGRPLQVGIANPHLEEARRQPGHTLDQRVEHARVLTDSRGFVKR